MAMLLPLASSTASADSCLSHCKSNPASLDGAKWDKIMRINKTLYGFIIREKEQDIVKARFPGIILLDLRVWSASRLPHEARVTLADPSLA
jgi:hypothetical protein